MDSGSCRQTEREWDIPLAHYIYPYTLSILDNRNEAKVVLGSGTGILWHDRCLIIAAFPALAEIPQERLCFIPPNPRGLAAEMSGNRTPRVSCLPLQTSKIISSKENDLAAVVLAGSPPNLRDRHFYSVPENDPMPPLGCSVAFVGYPGMSSPKVKTDRALTPHCASAYTVPCIDARDVGVAFSTRDQNPGGFIGAGFWYWQTIKYPTPSLFGIIHAYSQSARILHGYKIESVIRFLHTVSQ
jgi:hypothetical protein